MTDKNIENNFPVLTFEGKKYNVNDLSNETKEIIKSLRIAETQLKMYEDTLKLLSIGLSIRRITPETKFETIF